MGRDGAEKGEGLEEEKSSDSEMQDLWGAWRACLCEV